MTFISKCSANLFAVCLACLWGVILTGCARTAVVGLYPDNPPVTRKGVLLRTEFVEVDTLNPTFRWHPLAIRLDSPEDKDSARIENITYEIRIWRTVSSDAGKLVYQRSRLTTTEHRLEHALDYGTRYFGACGPTLTSMGKPERRNGPWPVICCAAIRFPTIHACGSRRPIDPIPLPK
jgi:hypothetical protein